MRGIYKDATGFAVVVRLHGKPKEYRYPPETSKDKLRSEQERLQKVANRQQGTGRGSIQAAAERYLDLVTLTSPATVKAEILAWAKRYPKKKRHQLTREDVLSARKAWLDAGLSAKSVNHRVHRLHRLFKVLDGPDAWTPCEGIAALPVPRTPIDRTDAALVNKVLSAMQASEASGRLSHARWRARLMVIASHGRRPSEVGRAVRSDVDLKHRVWVPRDGKGGFTEGLYLNDEQVAAWELMITSDAFGPFDVSEFVDILKAHGWPTRAHPTRTRKDGSPALYAHPRPYNLRHTFALTLSEAGHDLADIGPMLGHKRLDTTRRYYLPVLGSRMQRLSESINTRFGWLKKPKTAKHGTKRGTRRQPAKKSTR